MLAKDIVPILERQHLPVFPGMIKTLEETEAKETKIRSQRYQPDRERALIAEARREAVTRTHAELEQVVEKDDVLTRLKQDKAQIEAEGRGESDTTTMQQRIDRVQYQTEAQRSAELERRQDRASRRLLVAAELPGRLEEVRDMTEASDLASAYADAVLTNDARTISAVGPAVLRKLRWKEAQVPEHNRAALTQARVSLQARHDAWVREHPSVLDRLRQVEANISGRERHLRDAHRHTLTFAGLR